MDMMVGFLRRVAALASAIAILGLAGEVQAQSSLAQEVTGTLKKVRDQGAIYLGYREDALPLSYANGSQVQGYFWDLCGQVVEAVKARLELANLPVVAVPVTANNRFMMVRTGTVDLECGGTANTASRQRQAGFSLTTYVAAVKILVKDDSPIKSLADMDGRQVVTTRGSGAERHVKTAIALRSATLGFASADGDLQSMQWLAAGKADAFAADEAQLAALRAAMPDPTQFRFLEENLVVESYALVFAKDDLEFKRVVDDTLASLMKSGGLEKTYQKWFMSPIPPKGINLNLPMGDLLKALVRSPSDRAG